jgi:hypothetical protein
MKVFEIVMAVRKLNVRSGFFMAPLMRKMCARMWPTAEQEILEVLSPMSQGLGFIDTDLELAMNRVWMALGAELVVVNRGGGVNLFE